MTTVPTGLAITDEGACVGSPDAPVADSTEPAVIDSNAVLAWLWFDDPALRPLAAAVTSVLLMGAVAVLVGSIESLVARLRLRTVPTYLMLATAMAAVMLAAAGYLASTH